MKQICKSCFDEWPTQKFDGHKMEGFECKVCNGPIFEVGVGSTCHNEIKGTVEYFKKTLIWVSFYLNIIIYNIALFNFRGLTTRPLFAAVITNARLLLLLAVSG